MFTPKPPSSSHLKTEPVHLRKVKKTSRRKIIILFFILLCVGLLISGVAYIKVSNKSFGGQSFVKKSSKNDKEKEKKKKENETKSVLTVEVVNPTLAQIPIKLSSDGVVVAKDIATVNSKVGGMAVESIAVNEGDWVEKGQVLATLDYSSLEQNLIQARAQVSQAQVGLQNAQAQLNRVKPLLAINAVSAMEVDNYSAQVLQAQANLLAVQSQMKNQEAKLNDSNILSPVSGIISKKNVSIGQIPQGSLFTIINDGALEWQTKINPKKVSQLKAGTPVLLETPNKQKISGELSRIEPIAGNDRQVNVRVTLSVDKDTPVQSGILLTGDFLLANQNKFIVPVTAVVNDDGYNYLVLATDVKENANKHIVGTVKRMKVTLGEQFDNAVVINSDIAKDLLIIRQGGAFLNDGDNVRLFASKKPAQAS